MQKLIVGCGYLGGRVADIWIAQGHQVHALTRSSERATEFSRRGINPIIGDLCDLASLPDLPAVETILFAVGYEKSSRRTRQQVQLTGLQNVLARVASADRLVYISSSSVYGQSAGEWVDETSDCQPVQPGGISCLETERWLMSAIPDSTSVTRANVLRLSGIYGPDRLLSRIESLRSGEALSGSGTEWLNLIHVDDAAVAVIACELHGKPNQTFLVSDDQPISRADYYGLLASLVGAPSPRFDPGGNPSRGSGGINKRCRNKRLREELQVTLQFPTITVGLPHALAASLSGPTPRPTE
ncbi:MAG: dependent epimerase/dehydratase family protein [Schlesneria sp.]|nr:dependent epimerase/dehydratase family protein [Schlesneria sp.]